MSEEIIALQNIIKENEAEFSIFLLEYSEMCAWVENGTLALEMKSLYESYTLLFSAFMETEAGKSSSMEKYSWTEITKSEILKVHRQYNSEKRAYISKTNSLIFEIQDLTKLYNKLCDRFNKMSDDNWALQNQYNSLQNQFRSGSIGQGRTFVSGS